MKGLTFPAQPPGPPSGRHGRKLLIRRSNPTEQQRSRQIASKADPSGTWPPSTTAPAKSMSLAHFSPDRSELASPTPALGFVGTRVGLSADGTGASVQKSCKPKAFGRPAALASDAIGRWVQAQPCASSSRPRSRDRYPRCSEASSLPQAQAIHRPSSSYSYGPDPRTGRVVRAERPANASPRRTS